MTQGSRYLFITPTLRGILDDYSYANPNRSNRVLERFARVIEVPSVRFYTHIELLPGSNDEFGYKCQEQTYKKTSDVALVEGKTYYTKSGDVYTPVAEPDVSDIATYYEVDVAGGQAINFMVVEKSAVIKFDKHVASRVFQPDELESLDSYMMKYRKYGIVELLDNKLAGVHVSAAPLA